MDKVTMYFRSEFGMGVVKVEATKLKVEVKPHAQYERGVYAEFVPKGKRKARCLVQAYGPSLVVLEGWGHPDPDGMFLPAQPGHTEDVMVAHGRYSACDPRWQSDFDTQLAAYLERFSVARPEKGPLLVLYDFRGHQPGCRGMVSQCTCFSCECEFDATH